LTWLAPCRFVADTLSPVFALPTGTSKPHFLLTLSPRFTQVAVIIAVLPCSSICRTFRPTQYTRHDQLGSHTIYIWSMRQASSPYSLLVLLVAPAPSVGTGIITSHSQRVRGDALTVVSVGHQDLLFLSLRRAAFNSYTRSPICPMWL
jgi:hypothetical protein